MTDNIEVLASIVSKLDVSLEKIADSTFEISKLLAVHDQRIDRLESDTVLLHESLQAIHSRISTQSREIIDKIETLNDKNEVQCDAILNRINSRLDTLEKWRYYSIGIATTVTFIISTLVKGII